MFSSYICIEKRFLHTNVNELNVEQIYVVGEFLNGPFVTKSPYVLRLPLKPSLSFPTKRFFI